jgi:hypothetical protein
MTRIYVIERNHPGTSYYLFIPHSQRIVNKEPEKSYVTLQKLNSLSKSMKPEHDSLIYVEE